MLLLKKNCVQQKHLTIFLNWNLRFMQYLMTRITCNFVILCVFIFNETMKSQDAPHSYDWSAKQKPLRKYKKVYAIQLQKIV